MKRHLDRNFFFGLLAAFVVALTIGCAQLGLTAPQTFNEKAYAAALTIDSAQRTASTLLKAGKITPGDAENVLKATDVATEGIKIARVYTLSSPAAANTRLDAAVAGLAALTAYLATQGGK